MNSFDLRKVGEQVSEYRYRSIERDYETIQVAKLIEKNSYSSNRFPTAERRHKWIS
jgi:hypothetical protein